MLTLRIAFVVVSMGLGLARAHAQDASVAVKLDATHEMELIHVSRGEFEQGSAITEQGRKEDESLHHVELSSDFLIGKVPVTVGQFKIFVDATRYKTEAEKGSSGGSGFDGKQLTQRPEFNWRNPGFPISDDHPVSLVTVEDANAFLKWLSQKANRKFTLPSEAQWEYACRGGTQSRFYSGDQTSDLDNIGWYQTNAGKGTMPVGKKVPNSFGIYDMSGNCFEWCLDVYAKYPSSTIKDPVQLKADAGDKVRNVLRGGSFLRNPNNCRSAARHANDARSRNADNGFRVCALVTSELTAAEFQGTDMEQLSTGNSAARPTVEASPAAALPTSNFHEPSVPQFGVAQRFNLFSLLTGCICLVPFLLIPLLAYKFIQGIRNSPLRQIHSGLTRGEPGFQNQDYRTGQFVGLGNNTDINLASDVGVDGFWLNTQSYDIGSTVHVQYYSRGKMNRQPVVVQSKPKQFVYTGDSPSNITVLNVVSPETEPFPSNSVPYQDNNTVVAPIWINEPKQDDSPEPPPSFRGHPPAY